MRLVVLQDACIREAASSMAKQARQLTPQRGTFAYLENRDLGFTFTRGRYTWGGATHITYSIYRLLYIHIYTYIHTYLSIYIYICISIHIYVYIYTSTLEALQTHGVESAATSARPLLWDWNREGRSTGEWGMRIREMRYRFYPSGPWRADLGLTGGTFSCLQDGNLYALPANAKCWVYITFSLVKAVASAVASSRPIRPSHSIFSASRSERTASSCARARAAPCRARAAPDRAAAASARASRSDFASASKREKRRKTWSSWARTSCCSPSSGT